jgi:hypothetical protein
VSPAIAICSRPGTAVSAQLVDAAQNDEHVARRRIRHTRLTLVWNGDALQSEESDRTSPKADEATWEDAEN